MLPSAAVCAPTSWKRPSAASTVRKRASAAITAGSSTGPSTTTWMGADQPAENSVSSSWKPRLALRLSGRPLMPETPRCMNSVGAATASSRRRPRTRLSAGRRMMTAAARAHQLPPMVTGRTAPAVAGSGPVWGRIGAAPGAVGRRPGA